MIINLLTNTTKMIVTVIRVCDKEKCWYSECIGDSFHAFRIEGSPFIFHSANLFFVPGDVIEDKSRANEAFLPYFHPMQKH